MSTLELREQLINKIKVTTDDDVLEGMLKLLEFESNRIEVYKFNDEQKNAISMAREQYARGEYYTEEEADKITEKWLNA